MRKNASLSSALKRAARSPEPEPVGTVVAPAAQAHPIAPSRHGKKVISGFFDPAVSRSVRQLALERDASVQQLLEEAITDLLRKYGQRVS